MITYNIQLDEKLIEPLLLEFGDKYNVKDWIQEQIQFVIIERSRQIETPKKRRRKVAVSQFVKSIGRKLDLPTEPNEKEEYRNYLESDIPVYSATEFLDEYLA